MNGSDQRIAETLGKFGEPMAGNVWRVQGTAVIYHKTLERIAATAQIAFEEPTIIRAERDEAVMKVTGKMGQRTEWSIGEALIGVNYRVSGKQAAYVYAMAEKRAKDRVILKLIDLHGFVYSEEEADEFKQARSDNGEEQPAQGQRPVESRSVDPSSPAGIEADLKSKIDKAKTINAVTDLMLHADTQKSLSYLAEGIRDQVREYAKERLVELGWPRKADSQQSEPRTRARMNSNPPLNPEDFLKRLDTELSAAKDYDEFDAIWQRVCPEAVFNSLFPPDQEAAQGLYRKHEKRFEP